MKNGKRKSWAQPKLIVLVRGTPDENVLQACRGTLKSPRSLRRSGCYRSANCVPCNAPQAS
jgi:hypothetical protein